MPEKKGDNKILAMLERSGVIRKSEAEEKSPLQDDSGIRPLFDPPDDALKITPAARQPIPGMPNPVFPSDINRNIESARPQMQNITDLTAASYDDKSEETQLDEYEDPNEPEFENMNITTSSSEPIQSVPAPVSVPQPNPPSPIREFNAPPEYSPSVSSVSMDRNQQSENYTDIFLNTEELYDALALRSKKTDTIYLVEEFLQTLPDSLPDSQRRDIVGKLLAASGFDYDLLMGDGVLRVKMLKEYAERFARYTDDFITSRQAEIEELDQQILRLRKLIENRKELHKKQFFSIETEAQRLKEILTFISG